MTLRAFPSRTRIRLARAESPAGSRPRCSIHRCSQARRPPPAGPPGRAPFPGRDVVRLECAVGARERAAPPVLIALLDGDEDLRPFIRSAVLSADAPLHRHALLQLEHDAGAPRRFLASRAACGASQGAARSAARPRGGPMAAGSPSFAPRSDWATAIATASARSIAPMATTLGVPRRTPASLAGRASAVTPLQRTAQMIRRGRIVNLHVNSENNAEVVDSLT